MKSSLLSLCSFVTRIVQPAVSEVLKAQMALLTAEEILTRRLELKKSIDDGLVARLGNYGVKLHDLSIVNLTFSKDFTEAVERKQIAEQRAKQAEYETLQAEKMAQAEVARAKGKAEAQRLMKRARSRKKCSVSKRLRSGMESFRRTWVVVTSRYFNSTLVNK